jgi:sialate O-acetylesterase
MKKILLPLVVLFAVAHAYGNVKLPRIFTDNMVLQRNKPLQVWGWADAGESVTVQLNKQSKKVKADKTGKWTATLAAEAAGGPYEMTVKGKNSLTIKNILVGEVWVCSGQSNMEWPLSAAKNATLEIQSANFPEIRQFLVQKAIASIPQADVAGGDWKSCTPETAGNFTAVGYFFARDLYNKLHVPIGLIHTSWGGTHSETWTSREAFEQSAEFKSMIGALPKIDLESYAADRKARNVAKLKEMNIIVPATNVTAWKDAGLDDQSWPTMSVPGVWENQRLDGFDGVVWFRRTFTVSDADAGKDAVLSLGAIDDIDETFINGTSVGKTAGYDQKRTYRIPAGLLKAGKNVIAVRVEDTGGGGGLWDEPGALSLTAASEARIALAGPWKFNVERVADGGGSVGPNSFPTLLFNAMLNPLIPYTIAGAIWYQGESNAGRAYQYRTAFPLMIKDWRSRWGQGDFPFYFVQLAAYEAARGANPQGTSAWAELREAQRMTLSLPNTGMAVTTDVGEAYDIHPRNKQDVGKRLAAIALSKLYAQGTVASGPSYQSVRFDGNKAFVTFTEMGGGLVIQDKYGYLRGFEVAGEDKKFHYAKAWLQGNEVVVASDEVAKPVAVRFGWSDNPWDDNLYNKEGLPASPFRTDTWKGVTEGQVFTIE